MNVNAVPFVPGARASSAAPAAPRTPSVTSPVLPLVPARKDGGLGTPQIIPFAKRPDCMFFVTVCDPPTDPKHTRIHTFSLFFHNFVTVAR